MTLEVLKDILDAVLDLDFISCYLLEVTNRVTIGYNLRCSKVIE